MKKLILLLSLLFVLNSCDKDETSYSVVALPVDSVIIPSAFDLG